MGLMVGVNAVKCVNCAGKCLALWRQMPLVVGANAVECVVDVCGSVGNYRLWWRRMPFVGELDANVRASGGNCF